MEVSKVLSVKKIGNGKPTPSAEIKLRGQINSLRAAARRLLEKVESLEKRRQSAPGFSAVNLHEEVRRFETELICRALRQTGGHQVRAARLLGIKVTTLNSKIKRFGICPEAAAEGGHHAAHADSGDELHVG